MNLRLETIFHSEAESKLTTAEQKLLLLNASSTPLAELEEVFRCIHSVKGAASVVQKDAVVDASHSLEELIENYRSSSQIPSAEQVSVLLQEIDKLRLICFPDKVSNSAPAPIKTQESPALTNPHYSPNIPPETPPQTGDVPQTQVDQRKGEQSRSGGTLTLSSSLINDMLALSGDNLVSWRSANRITSTLQTALRRLSKKVRDAQSQHDTGSDRHSSLSVDLLQISQQVAELEEHLLRCSSNGLRLYHKTLECRLKPFGDSIPGWQRLVWDLSLKLQKQVKLRVSGASTLVDRELLQLLESPITHLIRNSVDHGIEQPSERTANGKAADGCISIHAETFSNRLKITLSDDGRGISRAKIHECAVAKRLSTHELLTKMSDEEISQFIFLPGFSTKEDITDISGRGVGLDVVHTEVQRLGGDVRLEWQEGIRTVFTIEVANQQSLVRSILFRVCGELYALPLVAAAEIVRCEWTDIIRSQGKLYIDLRGELIPIAFASEVLEYKNEPPLSAQVSLILLKDNDSFMALAVDSLERQEDISLQSIDPRLGAIPNVRSAAVTEAGELAIVLDERQLETSVSRFLDSSNSSTRSDLKIDLETTEEKVVLVVDDSMTVRELERKILTSRGYIVDIAQDGSEGLKMARSGKYHLIVTDVDMPEMNGIELVSLLKQDPILSNLPIIIVSYKDREEDRKRGLSAGADAYLTKSSFHDESFVQTVVDLVGEPYG